MEKPTPVAPSLPSVRGLLSAFPSPVVRNYITGDPRNPLKTSALGFYWVLITQAPLPHTKPPDFQRKTCAPRALHQPIAQVSTKR